MRSTPRRAKFLALLAGTALVAAACGSDGGGSADTTAAAGTEAPADTTAPAGTDAPAGSEAPAGDAAMTLTINLNPDAVWDDGTPITSADLECTWQAALNTPGSIRTNGYDKITAVDTSDPKMAVVSVLGAVRGLQEPVLRQRRRRHEGRLLRRLQ